MTKPVRLQLSRRKSFNLQTHSREANGLPAINVARPSKWGNPFRVGVMSIALTSQEAVGKFRDVIEQTGGFYCWGGPHMGKPQVTKEHIRSELRGKNLACWCAPDAPCHADVLLELANKES
jgi:hypothetical protein